MRIKSLELVNYRCFEKFRVQFQDTYQDENKARQEINLHVLLAPNMIGKSALLKGLRIAIGTPLQKIKANPAPANSLNITYDEHRVTGSNPFADKARNVEIIAEADCFRWTNSGWNLSHYKWKKYKDDYEGKHTKTEHLLGDVVADTNTLFNRVVENNEGIIPLLLYVGTEYIHQQKAVMESLNQDGSAKQGYWYCLDDKSMEAYVFDWFKILYTTVIEQERSPLAKQFYEDFASTTLNTFRNAVKQILPDILQVDWVRNTLAKRKQPKSEYFLVFDIEDQGVRTYEMLSDGYRYLILLIGELVTRATLLNKHLGERVLQEVTGVVLIDEFGIHLHPSLQSEALSRLSKLFPRVQFIVTTHSPLLINGLRKEQLHIISEDVEGKRIVEHPTEDAIGLGAEGILREMFGLVTTYDKISIDLNEEYKRLLKLKEEGLTPEQMERFEELSKRLAPMRLDPTLSIKQEEDPITKYVEEKLIEEAKAKGNENVGDVQENVNKIIDNLLDE